MAQEKTKFIEVELPIINEKVQLIAHTPEELVGRTVKMDLTRKLRGKSLEAIFRIKSINGELKVEISRLHLLGYFIRRMMRKSISYVEDSFSTNCKDSAIRVKYFMITRKKVSRAVRNAIRIKAKEEIINDIKAFDFADLASEIIYGKFQKNLSLKIKKVYPLALCEIRDIYLEPSQLTKTEEATSTQSN